MHPRPPPVQNGFRATDPRGDLVVRRRKRVLEQARHAKNVSVLRTLRRMARFRANVPDLRLGSLRGGHDVRLFSASDWYSGTVKPGPEGMSCIV